MGIWDIYLLCITKSWCLEVKEILDKLGYSVVWLNPTGRDYSLLLKETLKRLQDQYFQGWSSSLQITSGKLRTNKLFKFDINYENYLYLPPHLRVSLTRLRVSAHQLRIETGRYHRPKLLPVEERLCQMCNLSAVEDELHFVFQCPRYNDIRTELLKACRNHHHSFQYLLPT